MHCKFVFEVVITQEALGPWSKLFRTRKTISEDLEVLAGAEDVDTYLFPVQDFTIFGKL